MAIRTITDHSELLACRDQWNLVANDWPFSSWEWCVNWWLHLGAGMEPYVIVETDECGKWLSVTPMVRCNTLFGENKIYSMGSGDACTDYTSLIVGDDADVEQSTARFIETLTELRGNKNERIEVVEFEGVDVSAETTQFLIEQMEQQGYNAHCLPLESSWQLELDSDWETLNARFSKKHRRKTRKAIQRLEQSNIDIQYASRTEDFEGMWSSFSELHQQRRQMLGQAGCFADLEFEQFLKSATMQLLERGLAEIIQISLDGQPIAATLLFHNHQTAFMYQTGFDPAMKQLEPGYLLIVASMLWSIESEFDTFDFLRGDEPYKARWQTTAVELAKLRFVDTSTVGSQIRDNLWVNVRNAKSKVKQVKEKLHAAR